MKRFIVWWVTTLFLLSLMPAAHSQLSPIRMNVTKVEKKDRTTTYRSTSGQYRQQQVDITVHYNVELTNFSSSPLSDVQIKWAVLVDTARATARGGGISTSSGKLEVVEGERTGSLGVGQKYVFDTDPIDLNTARTDMTYDGRVWKYGGDVYGYSIVVLADGKEISAESKPNDTRQKIRELKAKQEKEANKKKPRE